MSEASVYDRIRESLASMGHVGQLPLELAKVPGWSPPRVIPYQWCVERQSIYDRWYRNRTHFLMVGITACVEEDQRVWVHLSMSHRKRVPRWDELRDAKDIFLGRDVCAYQVLPPQSEYVNIDDRVLHLWHCPETRPLPDFRIGGIGI